MSSQAHNPKGHILKLACHNLYCRLKYSFVEVGEGWGGWVGWVCGWVFGWFLLRFRSTGLINEVQSIYSNRIMMLMMMTIEIVLLMILVLDMSMTMVMMLLLWLMMMMAMTKKINMSVYVTIARAMIVTMDVIVINHL